MFQILYLQTLAYSPESCFASERCFPSGAHEGDTLVVYFLNSVRVKGLLTCATNANSCFSQIGGELVLNGREFFVSSDGVRVPTCT